MGSTRQSQVKDVKEDFCHRSIVALTAGDAENQIASLLSAKGVALYLTEEWGGGEWGCLVMI